MSVLGNDVTLPQYLKSMAPQYLQKLHNTPQDHKIFYPKANWQCSVPLLNTDYVIAKQF